MTNTENSNICNQVKTFVFDIQAKQQPYIKFLTSRAMQDFRSDKKRIYTNAKAFYRNYVEEFTVLLTFERTLNISKTEKAHYMGIDVGIVRE